MLSDWLYTNEVLLQSREKKWVKRSYRSQKMVWQAVGFI